LASAELAELHIAHVWNAAGEGLMRGGLVSMSAAEIDAYVASERARRTEALAALVDEAGRRVGKGALDWLRPTLYLEKGTPADELPALTGRLGADLLVLGTVGRSGIPGLLIGNTAESVLQRITCAVLALKPQGFVTPVTLPD
jgi:nucleotide-binding universal stress UspA family protein